MKQSGTIRWGNQVIARDRVTGKARAVFQGFQQTLRAILREIFDESAYERFLQHTKTARSVESYQAFMREKEASAARRPRCC